MKRLWYLALALTGAPAWAGDTSVILADDFEGAGDAGWTLNTAIWNFREGAGRQGSRALVYSRSAEQADLPADSPHRYFEVEPGYAYRLTCHYRGRADGRRNPMLEFIGNDAEGRRVVSGRSTLVPDNEVGNDGWQKLEALTPIIPNETKTAYLMVCFRGQFCETAAFDDLRIERVMLPPLSPLYSSAYRDCESEGPVEFVAECLVPKGRIVKPTLSWRGANNAIERREVMVNAEGEVRATLAVEELAFGASEVVLELRDADGALVDAATNRFTRSAKGSPRPTVYTDRHGRTIVNGQPFFPIGMESTLIPDGKTLEHYASGPFNCIRTLGVPTLEQLDKYHARGIMWIAGLQNYYYNVKRARGGARFKSLQEVRDAQREIILKYKDHPATLAWLTNDEMPITNVPDAVDTYRFFRELDPDHPVRCCIDQPQNIRAFMPSYDNVCTDPYPIGGGARRTIAEASEWTRQTRRQSFGIRSIWQVPQAFDWKWYRKPDQHGNFPESHMPTEAEMRSMSWQCIAEGANGLLWYAYNCYWKFTKDKAEFERCWLDVCTVASEVRRFAPMMLSVEPTPAVKTDTPKAVCRVWNDGRHLWLLVCNTERQPLTATVTLEGIELGPGVSALGDAPFRVEGSVVTLELPAIGVSIIRF